MSEQGFENMLSELAERYIPKHTCVIPHGQYQLLEKSENNDGSFKVNIKSPAYNKGKLVGHFIVSLNSVVFKENGDLIIYENVPICEEVESKGYITLVSHCAAQ